MFQAFRLRFIKHREQVQFQRALRDAEPRMQAELLAAARRQL
jgi:hypothetical protein